MSASWSITDDVPSWGVALGLGLGALALVLLWFELRRGGRFGLWLFITGALATALLVLAALRPVRVVSRGSVVGPRVVVLLDESRRLELLDGDKSRRERALAALPEIAARYPEARIDVLGFGEGPLRKLSLSAGEDPEERLGRTTASDLASALSELLEETGERPESVVLLSDGRLTRPESGREQSTLAAEHGRLGAPLHVVSVADQNPKDASVRAVRTAGAAVAHQPLTLTIEVGCEGLSCGDIPLTVRELRHGTEPALLASGVATIREGQATVELKLTLDRAGDRILEVAITPPVGDTIPANDRRLLSFNVARERIRLLHVAGRPTYDVRALRMWLKSDEAVDVVAFFILRTNDDDTQTQSDDELALIPFPVDELFKSLPTFDAIVLQDIDAVRYGINPHLGRLAAYVEAGGGLIMVGGGSSFSAGGYASTAIERVLPVTLSDADQAVDGAEFVPRYTRAGSAAPLLGGVRDLFGAELPTMTGTNRVGPLRSGSVVMWEHPTLRAGGASMPVLALGEYGDGRTIALTVDGTHTLGFSQFALRAAGRGYGALWDGLLGWLMREPRYESVRADVGPCIAGRRATLKLVTLPGDPVKVTVEIIPLGPSTAPLRAVESTIDADGVAEVELGALPAGGYSARIRTGDGPATRHDFACEEGGAAWADSRPDPARLAAIAKASGGALVTSRAIQQLPAAEATVVASERHVSAWLPPWLLTLLAALALGAHWVLRRRSGLV
ncbi:MAG: hypothetical protein KIT72_14215 [Polyangiaceae bacterium]|nr:hypothetical protein [Polyangiaceae bacterium]MCW5791568.1 hypothetical protein [Polyangiaceae bacterium]